MRPLRAHLPGLLAAAALLAAMPLSAQSHHPPLHVDPTLEECSVIFASTLTQGSFRRFAREFGSVSAFRQLSSATTLGRGEVSVGLEMMRFGLDQWSDAWNDTFAHPDEHHELGATQTFPKIKLRAGITDDLDVGAFYTRNPKANYGWLGIDAKHRMLTQSGTMPVSVALRGAYTKTLYVSDMDMHALTADVTVERSVGQVLRPYVGVGADGVLARETSNAVELRSENSLVPHLFAGFEVTKWRRLGLGAEVTWGALTSVQMQVGAVVF